MTATWPRSVLCGFCGKPQRGRAFAGDVPLCHDNAKRTCYVRVTVYEEPLLDGRVWGHTGWLDAPEGHMTATSRPDRYMPHHCPTCTCGVR